MDWNYYDTFIAASEDSPAEAGAVPPEREGTPTVAFAQHGMIARHPYEFTQEDVLFETSAKLRGRTDLPPEEKAALRADFLSKPTACLRSSPLAKRYGWGFHFDSEGKVALAAIDSPEYKIHMADPSLTQLAAMRSSRARNQGGREGSEKCIT